MGYSIIIPAFNEAANLPRLFSALAAARRRSDVETIVIDNGSTDGTAALAASHGAVVITPETKRSIAALRNLGAARARHDILLFLDADMEPPDDWLARIEQAFAEPDIDAFGFVEDIPKDAPWFAKIWSRRTAARRGKRMRTDFLPGRNICIRRALFEKVGGFSTDLQTSEDKDFSMRVAAAGGRVFSLPRIGVVHWGYERTFAEWCRKEFWRQHSHCAMLRLHGPSLRIIRFPMLSIGHLLYAGATVLLGLLVNLKFFLLTPFVFAPAFVMTLAHAESRRSLKDIASFTLLYAVRFHIAGASVLSEAFTVQKAARRGLA